MPTLIIIISINNKKYNTNKFTKVLIYLKGFNNSNNTKITIISREFYIINDLLAKVLIIVNILKLE